MHTKLLLCLIVRIQKKIYGEQIQDNRFMCLISRIRTKTYGEQIQGKRLLCLIARIRTKTYGEQIQDKVFLCQSPGSGRKPVVNKFKICAFCA